MHYDRPFKKAIVDLPFRIKGNSKLINQINKINTIWSYHIHIVVLRLPDSWSNWNWKMLVFKESQGEEKTGVPGEEPLGERERTNNKLNPLSVIRWVRCGDRSTRTGAASQTYYSVFDYVCDAGYRIKKNTFYVNPKSDQHQISPCNINAL